MRSSTKKAMSMPRADVEYCALRTMPAEEARAVTLAWLKNETRDLLLMPNDEVYWQEPGCGPMRSVPHTTPLLRTMLKLRDLLSTGAHL